MAACASCGAENREGARFCDSCGAVLADAERPRELRKTVTVLFCDVIGSTARAEQLDPEATRATMARYFETARAAIERHGGTIEKFIGDAVMAVFGVPQVHEDDALRAVRAALELRDAVEIDVRIGLNTGQVVTGSGDTLVTGDPVNVAARLEQAAGIGEVLLGADTYRLVRDAVDVELLPPLEAKGKSKPLTAYRLVAVTGEEAHIRRFDAPLVGRDRESQLLAGAWARVLSERSCALFTILGSAGVGKSRLAQEFLAGVDATVVSARCLSYGEGITYWPAVEIVKQLLGAELPDDPAVAALLGHGQAAIDEIAFGVRKLLEARAAERPLVVLLDDLHWAEPAFFELVEQVADLSRDAPILLLCLGRPELLDRRPGWSGGKLNATSVLLEPLAAQETDDLIDGLLGGDDLDPTLRRGILGAAEGNPLFVEEMLAMLRESGGENVSVPPTIQALLAARIDQLPRAERETLERGSIEGQVFHRGAVQALSLDDSAVGGHLLGLVRKELVRPNATMVSGQDAFRFRHLLIRDAAYEALPKSVRAGLHERFADWIGEHGADLVELDEILGYHLEQAARYRVELGIPAPELAARAAGHLGTAGALALERVDHHAARNLLNRAVGLVGNGGAARARLLPLLAEAVYGTGDLEGSEELLAEAIALGTETGEKAAALRSRLFSSYIHGHMGTRSLAALLDELDLLLVEVGPTGDDDLAARAFHTRGWFRLWLGRADAGLADFLAALEHAEQTASPKLRDDVAGGVAAAMRWGSTPWHDLERFLDTSARGKAVRSRDHLGSDVFLHQPGAAAARGDFEVARAQYTERLRQLRDRGETFFIHTFAMNVAAVELRAGELAAAERILRDAWLGLESAGEKGFRSTVGAMLAETLAQLGRPDDAEAIVLASDVLTTEDDAASVALVHRAGARVAFARKLYDAAESQARQALRVLEATDMLEETAETHLLLGEVLAGAGSTEEAAGAFRKAVELAEAKGSSVLTETARAALAGLPS
ncbi:MAG: AAA family ATPase [Actinobacteria bacterium]|nr:AAA family ATPase [Actinomycetota bacterium]